MSSRRKIQKNKLKIENPTKILKLNLCYAVKGVGGGVWPKKIKFHHLIIFQYLDYGEANAFYRIEKAFSGAKI